MISVRILYLIINTITILLAYSSVVTLAGAFKAWVAKKMGDDTAYAQGFNTLNPLAHVDYIGLMSLYLIGIGWGSTPPVDSSRITGPWKYLKRIVAYNAEIFAYLFFACLGIVILSITYGSHMVRVSRAMLLCSQYLSQPYIEQFCPSIATEGLLFSYIIIVAIYACIIFASCALLRLGVILVMHLAQRNKYALEDQLGYINGITLVLTFFLLFPIKFFIIEAIATVGYSLARLFGL